MNHDIYKEILVQFVNWLAGIMRILREYLDHEKILPFISLILGFFLTSCPAEEFFREAFATSSQGTTIKLGEQTLLSVSLEWRGDYALVNGQRCYAFLYTPGNNDSGPFGNSISQKFDHVLKNVKNNLASFPLGPAIQGTVPVSDAQNVMPLLEVVVKPGKRLDATFAVKGAAVGKVKVGSTFICESPERLGQGEYDLMSVVNGYVSLTVVP